VSNCCPPDENRWLQDICTDSPRLEFVELAGKQPLPHGQALTLLQKRETSRTFACLDSDIFATGAFLPGLQARAARVDALFSCPPIWSTGEYETIRGDFGCVSGVYQRLHDGLCIGNSYFAIYDNDVLSCCIEETGVTFENCAWQQVPVGIQHKLTEQGRAKLFYDTGKLLNLLLATRGCRSEFVALPELVHIGGISGETLAVPPQWRTTLRAAVSSRVPDFIRKLAGLEPSSDWRRQLSDEELAWDAAKQARRSATCRYFSKLLADLFAGDEVDAAFDHPDAQLRALVARAQAQVEKLYWNSADRLNNPRTRAA
jgi:hypothetical protein